MLTEPELSPRSVSLPRDLVDRIRAFCSYVGNHGGGERGRCSTYSEHRCVSCEAKGTRIVVGSVERVYIESLHKQVESWTSRARRAEANIRMAAGVIDSFDPTSDSSRTRVFVSDLRNCLEVHRGQ